ncbi:guanylate kinase [Thermophilibacter sp.]
MARRARIFVVSGPSGVGKGTLVSLLRERVSSLGLTVSVTTRSPRPGEVDGVSYHFMDDAEFDRLVDEGAFLEWARVHDHRYGTLRSEVERVVGEGRSVVLEIDVQGALNVRRVLPEAVLVFIEPPSMGELERRLRARGTEDEAELELRLANARREMALAGEYDARVVNDDLERACSELEELIESYETDGGPSPRCQ